MKKIHRFICKFQKEGEGITIETGTVARQIQIILKLKEGETVSVCDGTGIIFDMVLTELTPQVRGRVTKTHPYIPEVPEITMYVAILKRDLFELVVQKLTEIGVMHIIPLQTDRTVKLGLKLDRLESIAKEAAEVSGRATVPRIYEPVTFTGALEGRDTNVTHVFFDLDAPDLSTYALRGVTSIAGWVGPEGGWSEKEVQKVKEAGFTLASLASKTFRGETAAIVGSFALLYATKSP